MQKYVHFPFVGQFSVKPHTCSMQKSRCVEHSPALYIGSNFFSSLSRYPTYLGYQMSNSKSKQRVHPLKGAKNAPQTPPPSIGQLKAQKQSHQTLHTEAERVLPQAPKLDISKTNIESDIGRSKQGVSSSKQIDTIIAEEDLAEFEGVLSRGDERGSGKRGKSVKGSKKRKHSQVQRGTPGASFVEAFQHVLGGKQKKEKTTEGDNIVPILKASQGIRKQMDKESSEAVQRAESKQHKQELKKRGHKVVLAKGKDPQMDAREKYLMRLATKGVVRLFNAVAQAQNKSSEGGERIETRIGRSTDDNVVAALRGKVIEEDKLDLDDNVDDGNDNDEAQDLTNPSWALLQDPGRYMASKHTKDAQSRHDLGMQNIEDGLDLPGDDLMENENSDEDEFMDDQNAGEDLLGEWSEGNDD